MAESQNGLNTGLNTSTNIDAQFATKQSDNPLWHYACQFYSQPKTEAVLLELQDHQGADINLILQVLWLASMHVEWTPSCIPDGYQQWIKEQVLPLRKMRRSMKVEWPIEKGECFDDFRQQVKALELKAEQIALGMLFEGCEAIVIKGDIENKEPDVKSVNDNLTRLAQYLMIEFREFKMLGELI